MNSKRQTYLRKIGLSKDAINIYEILLGAKNSLTVGEISKHTKNLDSAEYRLLYKLQDKGLVKRIKGRPMAFMALPMEDGLNVSLQKTQVELKSLLKDVMPAHDDEKARLIFGREEVYKAYIDYADKARKQICIYAIGIAYSKRLEKAQTLAIRRGVYVRHVMQELKPSNYHVLAKWQRLGIKLKQLSRSRGYHLVTIDDTCAIVTFSNPNDTEERLSMVTTNPAIVELFQHQFEDIWSSAKKIS